MSLFVCQLPILLFCAIRHHQSPLPRQNIELRYVIASIQSSITPSNSKQARTLHVAMGRRRRHNSLDDDDDAFEREWLKKRQKSAAKEEDGDRDNNSTSKDESSSTHQTAKGAAHHNIEQAAAPPPAPATKKDDTDNDADKVERLRLKKQLKKQRQKEKKAEAAKQAAEARQQKEKEKLQLQKIQKEQVAKKNEKKQFNESKQSNEFKSLRKGVKYLDLKVGNGQVVQHRKKIRVAYTLRAKNHTNGKIIDASKNFGFRLGKGEVIEGYDIGLEGMRVGGIRRLIVPKQAGYHNDDIGAGRGADLFFEIELLHVAP
jgi:FKBP-type peptidyl-prolyl cis-trans isomerase